VLWMHINASTSLPKALGFKISLSIIFGIDVVPSPRDNDFLPYII